jgi:hypothetical protein
MVWQGSWLVWTPFLARCARETVIRTSNDQKFILEVA